MHSNYSTLVWELGPFSWTPGSFPIACRCAAVALVSLWHARKNSCNPSPKAVQDRPQARAQKREMATSECYVSSVCFSESFWAGQAAMAGAIHRLWQRGLV